VGAREFRRFRRSYSRERPLIGVVGEIFCRLTPFSNDFTIRTIERHGGECSLAHIVEWVWYSNLEQQKRLRHAGRRFSKAMLAAKIKNFIQHRDEHAIFDVFKDDLRGYEEPPVKRLFDTPNRTCRTLARSGR
jgi:predicted nucleotide-binding protein (sugar kinase/HSP70/actin superfamily)